MAGYYGNDDYDYYGGPPRQRRPSPHHFTSGSVYLNPGIGSGLHRSRSHGHSPAPTINVYNRVDNEGSPYPQPYAMPYPPGPGSRRASPRASPESRGRSKLGDRLVDGLESEFVDMALEHRYGRSRSRGRSDASYPSPGRAEWELAQRNAELRQLSRERDWRLERDRIENKMKLEQLESERKKELAEEGQKRHDKRILEEYERKVREEKERAKLEEQKLKDRIAREEREEKEKEERMVREIKEREQKAKEKKEKEYQDFLREQKEREEKKKKEAKEEEEKIQEAMRKRLANLGYTQQTIDIMVDEEKAKKFKTNVEHRHDSRIDIFRAPRAPVYPKVHRDYLAVETLKYYDLPWEYDRSNKDYIIILRDMDKRETDLLFEHTSRLRAGKLLIEGKKDKPKLAMYRRRSRSRSGAPVLEKGILRLG